MPYHMVIFAHSAYHNRVEVSCDQTKYSLDYRKITNIEIRSGKSLTTREQYPLKYWKPRFADLKWV